MQQRRKSLFDELAFQIQFLRGLPTSFKSSLAATTADVAMPSPLPFGRVSDSVTAKSAHIEVVVQRGDWLCEIGRRHNVKLKSLLKANPDLQNPEVLPVGRRISIPQTASPTRVTSPSHSPTDHSSSATSSPPTPASSATPVLRIQQPEAQPSAPPPPPSRNLPHRTTNATLPPVTPAATKQVPRKEGGIRGFRYVLGAVGLLANLINVKPVVRNVAGKGTGPKKNMKGQNKGGCRGKERQAGVMASARERNAIMEGGVMVEPAPKAVQAPMSQNLHAGRVQLSRGHPGTETKMKVRRVPVKFGDTLAEIAAANMMGIRQLQRLNNLQTENIFENDVLLVTDGPVPRCSLNTRGGVRRTFRLLFKRQVSAAPAASGGGMAMGGPETRGRRNEAPRLEGRWKKKGKGFQAMANRWMRFNSPVTDGFISSPFGWRWGAFHEGVDLAADLGTPILASDRGTVTFAGWSGGYGKLVAIQHEGGFSTRYGHCCAIKAKVGQHVAKGQTVAAVGQTGHTTGPHLHFEVRKDGAAIDPFKLVNL